MQSSRVKAVYKTLGAAVALLATVSVPGVANAAAPSTVAQGVSDTEKLLGQIGVWLFGLIAAGAAIFFLRALWTMHSADDDSTYAKGRKHLIRAIVTLVIAGCVSAVIATLKSTYGF